MKNLLPEYTLNDLMHMNLDKLIETAERLGKLEELSAISAAQERNNFLELKHKFFHDVCGVPRAEKVNKVSYRDKIAKAIAERTEQGKDEIGKKLGFTK